MTGRSNCPSKGTGGAWQFVPGLDIDTKAAEPPFRTLASQPPSCALPSTPTHTHAGYLPEDQHGVLGGFIF